jgi:predicted branched-subunit amino acid permease
VRLVVWAVGSLLGCLSGLGLGFIPNLRFLGFCMGQVLAKSKAKKWIEDMGQGHPLVSEVNFEPSEGCGSTLGLQ